MKKLKIFIAVLMLAGTAQAQFAPIDEISPSCSPTGITKACTPGGGSFASFPGKYTLALKIGEHLFQDRLSIDFITRHPGMLNFTEVFSGRFHSPEANFEAPIRDGKLMSTFGPGFELAFHILVKENGKKYYVYFHVKSNAAQPCSSEGVAYLDPARTQVLGKFTMTKDTADCDCRTVK